MGTSGLLFAGVLAATVQSSPPPEPLPIRAEHDQSKYGYIFSDGRRAFPGEFESAGRFSEGLARVELNGKYGLIDTSGRFAIPAKFNSVSEFRGGYARAGNDSEHEGFINRHGHWTIPPIYQDAGTHGEGMFPVKRRAGKWMYLDASGRMVLPPKYSEAGVFSEGLAAVRIDRRWLYIDRSGKERLATNYDRVMRFSDGIAPVKVGKKYGYIDRTGALVVPAIFESAGSISEGLGPVKMGGLWGAVDVTGRVVVNPRFIFMGPYRNGIAEVGLGMRAAYVDTRGEVIWSQPQKSIVGLWWGLLVVFAFAAATHLAVRWYARRSAGRSVRASLKAFYRGRIMAIGSGMICCLVMIPLAKGSELMLGLMERFVEWFPTMWAYGRFGPIVLMIVGITMGLKFALPWTFAISASYWVDRTWLAESDSYIRYLIRLIRVPCAFACGGILVFISIIMILELPSPWPGISLVVLFAGLLFGLAAFGPALSCWADGTEHVTRGQLLAIVKKVEAATGMALGRLELVQNPAVTFSWIGVAGFIPRWRRTMIPRALASRLSAKDLGALLTADALKLRCIPTWLPWGVALASIAMGGCVYYALAFALPRMNLPADFSVAGGIVGFTAVIVPAVWRLSKESVRADLEAAHLLGGRKVLAGALRRLGSLQLSSRLVEHRIRRWNSVVEVTGSR